MKVKEKEKMDKGERGELRKVASESMLRDCIERVGELQ
jgi:hypothetical protein